MTFAGAGEVDDSTGAQRTTVIDVLQGESSVAQLPSPIGGTPIGIRHVSDEIDMNTHVPVAPIDSQTYSQAGFARRERDNLRRGKVHEQGRDRNNLGRDSTKKVNLDETEDSWHDHIRGLMGQQVRMVGKPSSWGIASPDSW
jgi:hypothetical protein